VGGLGRCSLEAPISEPYDVPVPVIVAGGAGESVCGAVPGLLRVRFPQTALRTRLATFTAPGSPRILPLGWGHAGRQPIGEVWPESAIPTPPGIRGRAARRYSPVPLSP
jgi:hypothetical protein